jgi:ketosteroid isomerase-like protein
MDALRELMTADCTHHVPGSHQLSGDFKGQDAVVGLYGRLFEETAGSLRVDLRSLLVDGRGHVVAVHRVSAERRGRRIEEDGCIVFRVLGDRITDLDECVADIDVANEFWA